MDLFANVKKRCLLLVVKSFLGRFFKDIHYSQLDEPEIHARAIGMSFRLCNLELNEELFNTQLMRETPFRLVSGTINEIKGTLSLGAVDGRSLEFEGIDLVVQLLSPAERAPPMAPTRPPMHGGGPAPAPMGLNDPSVLRRPDGSVMDEHEALYTSLITGDVTRQLMSEDILDAGGSRPQRGGAYAEGNSSAAAIDDLSVADIDEGLDALATTIKGVIHSLKGKVRHVTVRLRVPPTEGNGSDSSSDVPFDASVGHDAETPTDDASPLDSSAASANVRQEKLCASELLIHMKGEIELLDETQPNSFGNSFRKRVRFAGLRVAVYDAYEVETTDNEEVQRIQLEDTILSGDLDAMENEIGLQFIDVDRRVVGAQSTWKIKVSVKQAHALLSPNQLARVSMIASALCAAAPEATPNDGAATPGDDDASNPQSKLTIQLGSVSCSVLVSEQPEAMRAAWGRFPAAPFCDSLTVPHYAIRTGGAQLQVRSGAMPTSQATDKLYELFRRYGNRYVSLWLDFVEVVERRPSFDPTIVFRIFNSVDGAGSTDGTAAHDVQAPAPLRLLLRSTSAIHADDVEAAIGKSLVQFAKRKGVLPNHRRSVVRQDVFVSLGDVSVDADVETIDRLLEFYNIVDAHLFRVSHPTALLPPLDDDKTTSPQRGRNGSQPSSSAHNGGSSSSGASPFGDDAEFFGNLGSMQRMDEGMLSDERPPPRNRQPSSSLNRRQNGLHLPPVVLSSARFEVDSGCVRMAFPVDRTPNIDVYGPLTQRLFTELMKQAQAAAPTFAADDAFAPKSAHHGPDTGRPNDLMCLSKVLQLDVVDVQIGLPTHSPHLVLCNLRSASCALIDSFEGSRTELVTAEFEAMDDDVTHAPDALLDSDTCIAVTRQSKKGPSMLLRCEDAPNQGFAAAIHDAWGRLKRFGPSEPLHRFLEAECTLLQQSPMACALRIQHVEVSLHQDELLLLLFLVDQIVECLTMAMETHAALLSHVKDEHNHRLTHAEQQQQDDAGRSASSISASRAPPRVASTDSATFATPLHTKGSRFSDPPASVIREQLLKSSKLMTSAYNPRQSVRSGWDGKKSAMFYSIESEAVSNASSGTLWGSHRNRRREEEGAPVAVHVHIASGWLTLYAPRLLPSGLPIGEPLHMLLPLSERYNETDLGNPKWLYHTYSIEARNAVVVVTSNTIDAVTSVDMNLRLERLEVAEKLCPIPPGTTLPPSFGCQPPWGGVQLLLQGYGDLYNRSHQIVDPEPRQTLLLYLHKDRNVEKMAQTTQVDLSIDRCCLLHQAAHEGDHWLFAVMNFIADNPTAAPPTNGDGDDDGDKDAVDCAVPCPLSFTTSVGVKSCDFLVQYRPLGRDCMLLVLVPFLQINVGPLTADPNVVIAIRFDKISILVHNHFADDVLLTENSSAKGFGATRRGVSRDLEALGFVQVLCAGSIDSASDNVVVRIKDVPDKPVDVHVAHVKVEFSCAYDACYYFQLVQSHFGVGGDMQFIPKPFSFVSAFSSRYALHAGDGDASTGHGSHARKTGEPIVRILVDDLSHRMQELIRSKLAPPTDTPPLASESPTSTNANHPRSGPPPRATTLPRGYSDDLDQDGIDSPVRITESQLDDFVDAGVEFEAVRRGEVESQRVPLWDIVADATQRARPPAGRGLASDDERTPTAAAPTIRDVGIPAQRVAKHFSQFRASNHGQRHADPLMCPRKLLQCPPIAVEVLVTDCHADVKLYGGSDFGLGFFSVHSDDGYSETMAFFQNGGAASADAASNDDEQRTAPRAAPFELSLASHPPGRRVNECIALALRYIFLQVDLFEPGHDQSMHLLAFVRDVEIRDLIDGSPVQTIMMCSIPRELRDHDGWAFEMKWVTRTPLGSRGGVGRPEEDLSFRLQPMVITIHRRVIDLLMLFVETPNIEAPPSTMFFRRLVVHPLRLRLNVLFEVQNYQALFEGQPMELASLFPSVQDSRVWLPMINLESFPVADFAVMLADALQSQVSMDAVLMLLCGVQPVRTVAEASSATAGLVLMPLDHYKRSKNLYRGILKGLSNFSTRIGAEALNVAGGATRTAHETIHMATATVRQQEILSRGNQPASVAEGFLRGAGEVADGFRGVRDIVRYCISDDGSVAQLPLAALAPVNGVMRALTQIFTGTRNTFRPDAQMMDRKIFKN